MIGWCFANGSVLNTDVYGEEHGSPRTFLGLSLVMAGATQNEEPKKSVVIREFLRGIPCSKPLSHPKTLSMRTSAIALLVATQALAQATPAPAPGAGALSLPNADPFPSTYVPFASRPTLIRNV